MTTTVLAKPTTITKEEWKRWFDGKTHFQMAEQIIGNLLGYRKTSLKRSDDTDNLVRAIVAILEEGR